MTAPASEAATRSGVVVALPVPATDAVLAAMVRERGIPDTRFATGERAVVALLGFGASGDDAVVALERLDVADLPARVPFEAMLGFPIRDAVRVDAFVSTSEPQAAVSAELALLALAADLARTFGGVVRDDIGAFYELRELEALVAAGATRFSSAAYVEAAARLSLTLPVVEPAAATGAPRPGAEDADASARLTVFVCLAPFVCVGGLVRIARSLADADREMRLRAPIVFAPVLDARHALVFAESGVEFVRTPDALADRLRASGATAAGVDIDAVADELDVFSLEADPSARRVREIFDRSALDLAASVDDPVRASALPSVATIEAPGDEPGLAFFARYAYPAASVDVRSVDLDRAHPLVRDAVGARTDVALLLGGPPSACTTLTLETPRRAVDGDLERADAFATSLAAEICRERDVATDAFAALFTRDRLVALALERRGRASSRAETLARLDVSA